MRKPQSKSKGASVDDVAVLHKLALDALIQQLKTEMKEGQVKAATVTAALKLCSDSGVTATMSEEGEIAELSSLIEGLQLSPIRY